MPHERPGRAALLSLALLVGLGSPALAEPAATSPPAGEDPAAGAEAPTAPDSPRATIRQFIALAGAGRWDDAARWLDVPPALAAHAPVLARRLRLVLESHDELELARLSPLPAGTEADGLPPSVDEIAHVPGASGPEPVRLVRHAAEGRWLFSRTTVGRIDAWYERLPHRWLLDRLPTPLVRVGWGGLMWWQWLALPALVAFTWVLGALASRLARRLGTRIVKRTPNEADDRLVDRMGPPLTLVFMAAGLTLIARPLGLSHVAASSLAEARAVVLLIAAFWAVARSIDVGRDLLNETPWARATPASRALLPLGARVAKVTVVALGLIAVVSRLGYPVTSLIAGLGIGGLAVALAAQKTVENIFGAVALGIDQPFRIGDLIKVDGVTGNVEQLGLRSTRIRTAERTLITIPNGALNGHRIESMAARERFRLASIVTLAYGATAAQVRAVRDGIDRVLHAEPTLWPDDNLVRVRALGDAGIELELNACFATAEWADFAIVRERLLLEVLEVVEGSGARLAYPTRTVHVVGGATPAAAPPR